MAIEMEMVTMIGMGMVMVMALEILPADNNRIIKYIKLRVLNSNEFKESRCEDGLMCPPYLWRLKQ